jgi:hypothetical protein
MSGFLDLLLVLLPNAPNAPLSMLLRKQQEALWGEARFPEYVSPFYTLSFVFEVTHFASFGFRRTILRAL